MSEAAPDLRPAVAAYAAFFETLTPETLPQLRDLCAPDVRFRDPFNDVTGAAHMESIFRDMFRPLVAPRFAVTHWAVSGETAYLRWTMTFRRTSGGRLWTIEGVSEVRFDAAGRVVAHIDHWDAAGQLYERLPLIGALLRRIRRRLSHSPS